MPNHVNAQRNGAEGFLVCERQQFVQRFAGRSNEFRSGFLQKPMPQVSDPRSPGSSFICRLLLTPRPADNTPPITRGGVRMNDERGHRSPPLCLFEFVGPAAVVGQRRTAEEIGVVGRRFVREIDEHLALQV